MGSGGFVVHRRDVAVVVEHCPLDQTTNEKTAGLLQNKAYSVRRNPAGGNLLIINGGKTQSLIKWRGKTRQTSNLHVFNIWVQDACTLWTYLLEINRFDERGKVLDVSQPCIEATTRMKDTKQ